MRILHFVDSMDPAKGGPPASVTALAAAQAAAGNDVTVAWRETPGQAVSPQTAFSYVPDVDKVSWGPYAFGLKESLARVRIIEPLRRGPDDPVIVHVHGLWRPEFLGVMAESRHQRIPYLIGPRGMLAPWSLAQKRLKKAVAWRLFWKRALERAVVIHALNEDEAEQVRAAGITAPIEIIPNGVFLDQVQAVRTPYRLSSGRPYVLFLGRLHPVKGLDVLARAFGIVASRMPDLDLVVVGPDDGERAGFESLARQLGIGDRVHLTGPVYGAAKYEMMAGALCLCAPSRQEGFSMSIVEALGMGIPVVISRACHLPEVATAGAGEVVELQPEAVAQGLLALLAHPDRLRSAGAAARVLVTARFQWRSIATQTLAIYERLCSAKSEGP